MLNNVLYVLLELYMKNSFLVPILSVGLLLGSVSSSIAQRTDKIPATNLNTQVLVRDVHTPTHKYVPNSPDESTPIAPFSQKEIKKITKNTGNSVLGGDKKINVNLPGVKVGYTYYDFQTNNSMPERLALFSDGNDKYIQMFWMASLDSSKEGATGQLPIVGFNNQRGAHYAFVDVSKPDAPASQYEWKKMAAEKNGGTAERRGWPSIVQFKNGSVGTPSHTPVDFFKSPDVGDENFTRTTVDQTTSTWPRAAIDGQDIVHVIYNTNASTNSDATQNFTCYRRSTDKGKTWEAEKILTNAAFDGNFPRGGGGDSYAIAARDNNVVILYGEYPSERALYRKSTDNGVTWSAPLLVLNRSFPGKDTTVVSGNTVHLTSEVSIVSGEQFDVIIDSEGKAHFAFNLTQAYLTSSGTKSVINGKDSITNRSDTINYLDQLSDYKDANLGILYYKEGDQFLYYIARPASINWDGAGTVVSRRASSGISRYPQLGIDDKDNIYMTFTSVKSGDTKPVMVDNSSPRDGVPDIQVDGLMGHIYVTHRLKGDNPNWSLPKDITPAGVDCLFGTLCNTVADGRMYIGYSADNTPGDRVTNTELPTEQTEIYVYPFPTTELNPIPPVGVQEEAEANDGLALTAQPNPTNGLTVFAFTAPQNGNAKVTLTNGLGMNVAILYNGMLTAGTTQSVNFNAQNLSSGAYYATFEINGRKITKMVSIIK